MSRNLLLLFFAFGVFYVAQIDGANILAIFQHYGFSHFKVYLPVLQELAERGHNLTVISYTQNMAPHKNYKELLLTGANQIHTTSFNDVVISRTPIVLLQEYFEMYAEGQQSCKMFYESQHVESVLSQHANMQPFDVVLTEYFDTDCHVGVPYVMDIPVIAFSSCALLPWTYDRIALPDFPSYIQSEFIGFPDPLNVFERLLNFLQMKLLKFLYRYHTNRHDNQLIKKYLHVDIDVYEEAKRLTSVIFVNQHYTLSGSRPMTPQLIELGGIHIDEKRFNSTMPPKVSDFLNNIESNQNVLLISFGSNLRTTTFDKSKLQAIVTAIEQWDNIKVIWKWESNDVPFHSKHILFVEWIPQLSLMCHPKVKYFWGHAGMLSTIESVYCGKPLIVTPIYGDQFLNAHAVQNRKIGLILDYNRIDEKTVANAIREIQRPRYSIDAQALSMVFRDRDIKPLDKAIWTIEHLLKHKKLATHVLQTKAVHLNFFVYHSLDSLMIIGFIISAFAIILHRISKCFGSERRTRKVKMH